MENIMQTTLVMLKTDREVNKIYREYMQTSLAKIHMFYIVSCA